MPGFGSGKSFRAGEHGFALFGATRLVITGWSANFQRDTYDVSNTSSAGWDEMIGGMRRVNGSIMYNISDTDIIYNTTDMTTNNSATPANNQTLVYLRLAEGPYLYGYAYLTGVDINSGVKSVVASTTGFVSTGDWFIPTTWS